MSETTLIENGVIVTMDERKRIFDHGSIAIRDNLILEVGKAGSLQRAYKYDKKIDAKGKVIIPGLINTHLHSGLIRGTADDMEVVSWLKQKIYPKHQVLRADDAYAAAMLSYCESLKSGCTCVLDMYRFMDRCAVAAEKLGIRAVLSSMAADRPEYSFLEKFDDNEKLVKEWKSSSGLVKIWFGFEHTLCCTDELLEKIAKSATKYKTGINLHSSEDRTRTELVRKKYGVSPIKVLHDFGILTKKTVIAHGVWLASDEIRLLAETSASIAHNPISNMKLASGVSPVVDLLAGGVNVGLGTDGLKENNSLDMFEVMKVASLLQKVERLDPTALPAEQVLEMATINGARALGLNREVGSIEVGKKADIAILNFRKPRLAPMLLDKHFNVVSHLVYAAHGDDAETVLVNGKPVVENGKLLTADEDDIIDDATKSAEALLNRRDAVLQR